MSKEIIEFLWDLIAKALKSLALTGLILSLNAQAEEPLTADALLEGLDIPAVQEGLRRERIRANYRAVEAYRDRLNVCLTLQAIGNLSDDEDCIDLLDDAGRLE